GGQEPGRGLGHLEIGRDRRHDALQPPGQFEAADKIAQAGGGHGRLYRAGRRSSHQLPGAGAIREAGRGRSSHSEPKADKLRPTVSRTARIPTRSSNSPNRNGAAASERRAGTDNRPVRSPYPDGPKIARGRVPRAIVIM